MINYNLVTKEMIRLPDMSNGNRTRKTCNICLCLRKFLCSEVNILKSSNTILNSIYFSLLYCNLRSGKCYSISKNPGFPGCEVCCLFCSVLLLDMFWCIVGELK